MCINAQRRTHALVCMVAGGRGKGVQHQARTEGGFVGFVRTPPPVPVANKNQNLTIL